MRCNEGEVAVEEYPVRGREEGGRRGGATRVGEVRESDERVRGGKLMNEGRGGDFVFIN